MAAGTGLNRRQRGFTLLEMMIAISVFALIGVASFRVLNGVVDAQQVGERHSQQLAVFQKALLILDRDLQQVVDRPVRVGPDQTTAALRVFTGDYPLEFTRGGWLNPLLLPRSSLQRVAYDLGPHPAAEEPGSPFYGDQRQYLRRLYWYALDREQEQAPVVQALLPDITDLAITVVTDDGRQARWPPPAAAGADTVPEAKALELTFSSGQFGDITRVYKLSLNRH